MTEGRNFPKRLLFFDGVCNLCNSFIDFMIQRIEKDQMYFAPLQGMTAEKVLGKEICQQLKSVVYSRDGKIHFESAAAIHAIADLGGLWSLFRGFMIFPGFLRDPVYRFIARNRYKWFGQKDTCRLPTDEEKQYFLD